MLCNLRILLFFAFIFCLNAVFAKIDNPTFYRDFWQPAYHCLPLNYCALDGKCGLSVANRYCRIMGYDYSNKEIIAHDLGLTNIIASHARCKGWECDGFKLIRCVKKKNRKPKSYHYRLKKFVVPRFANYRVAWCYDGKTECGRRAAYSFCRRLGYLTTRSFGIEKNVPATKALKNQKLCFGSHCEGFEYIICAR